MEEIPMALFDDGPAGVSMTRAEDTPSEWTRLKTGLNGSDEKAIVAELRAGATDEQVRATFGREIAQEALDAWLPELRRRAALPAGGVPHILHKAADATPIAVPAALAEARKTRAFAQGELERARRDLADFGAVVVDAEASYKNARSRAVLKRGAPEAAAQVAEARQLLQDAIESRTEAAEREAAAADAIATADAEIVQLEARFGQERSRRLRERLAKEAAEGDENLLDGLARVVVLREAVVGMPAPLDVALQAHFGERCTPAVIAGRAARLRAEAMAAVAAEIEAERAAPQGTGDVEKAAKAPGRRRGRDE